MEKGALLEMLGGMRFQTTVTITFFSSVNYCCALWSAFSFPYMSCLPRCNICLNLEIYKFSWHYHCFYLIMDRKEGGN